MSCTCPRLFVEGQDNRFIYEDYEILTDMVCRDYYMKDKIKDDILIRADGVEVGKAVYYDGFHYIKINQYPFDTKEKVFLRFCKM